jgi:ParB family chromosome partitioning protein
MSKQRRGGLGRGLGALIPTAPPAADHSAEAGLADAGSPADVLAGSSTPEPVAPTGTPASSEVPPARVSDRISDEAEPATADAAARGEEPSKMPADSPDPAGPAGTEPREAAESSLQPVPGAAFAELVITQIRPNPKQPRQVFDDDALAELTHSIREFGVLQPVVVRPVDDAPDAASDDGAAAPRWELVMGERRLRAATAAGLDTIPAIVRTTTDDAMLRDALLENVHRAQLNPLEEAAAYQQLLEEFGATHDELAQRLGRSRPQVSNTVRLLNLSLPVQRRVAAGVLSAGHARALLSLDQPTDQDELAARIVAEGLSVRATEELVALARRDDAAATGRRRSAPPKISAPAVGELADKLSDVLDTRVRVELGRRKGKITVEFASIDDLERIVAVMAPQLAPRRGSATGYEAGGAGTPPSNEP